MKNLTAGVLGIVMLLGAGAVGAMTEQNAQPAKPSFANVDLDRNGFISTHEAVQNDYLQQTFKKMDTNGDQQLSQDEYKQYQEVDEKKPG